MINVFLDTSERLMIKCREVGDKTNFLNKNEVYRICFKIFFHNSCLREKLYDFTVNSAATNSNYIILGKPNRLCSYKC